ncbi:hypothetical protein PGTUg99_034095 [Puccinia graminis f. sp. tritici]|uniref:Uncharacterized protein n=1 Tax=Puccinia graminis f. sp. tritici TaxID=56615 RepID=A0A5B0RWV1_PUCGR|nr:hypothetical protein PGTUg99_034095 [Puccinia graminis f. sp. tritici]
MRPILYWSPPGELIAVRTLGIMTSSGRSERCTSAPDFRSNIQPQSIVGPVLEVRLDQVLTESKRLS